MPMVGSLSTVYLVRRLIRNREIVYRGIARSGGVLELLSGFRYNHP